MPVAREARDLQLLRHEVVLGLVGGVTAYIAMTPLPIAARRERLVPTLADRWHPAIIGYTQGVSVLIGFLLLAAFGLA